MARSSGDRTGRDRRYCFYRGVARLEASKASILMLLEPLTAVLVGILVWHEVPRPLSLVGEVARTTLEMIALFSALPGLKHWSARSVVYVGRSGRSIIAVRLRPTWIQPPGESKRCGGRPWTRWLSLPARLGSSHSSILVAIPCGFRRAKWIVFSGFEPESPGLRSSAVSRRPLGRARRRLGSVPPEVASPAAPSPWPCRERARPPTCPGTGSSASVGPRSPQPARRRSRP